MRDSPNLAAITQLAKADANNRHIDTLLQGIKTKLELLARQTECPICLEPLEQGAPAGGEAGDGAAGAGAGAGADAGGARGGHPAVVLSCCHRVCAPCWRHWRRAQGTSIW